MPYTNNTDTQRLNMVSNHINQLVHLKAPEFPKVFTNFEDQIGEYSVAYKRAPEKFEIIDKIVKNDFVYDLIVKYKSGLYDIIHIKACENITEDYGYGINDCVKEKEVGDTVDKDEFIYKSDNYDDEGNFSYGVNLKAIYMPYKGLTYEDGVVISKSAAKKLTSYKVEKTSFSVNDNDVLLNLYGDLNRYQSFPKVGEMIHDKILVASRRKDKRSILYEFQNNKINEIDPGNDEIIFTGGGKVVDIDIFSNISLEDLKKKNDIFNKEILEVAENNYRYYKELADALEKIVPVKTLTEKEIKQERNEFGHVAKHPIERSKNPNKVSDELLYYWKISHEYIDNKIQWRYNGKSFNNFRLTFTILKENPLTPGCKITGRYGNKGIVSMIVDDEKMPITNDGIRAEAVLNPLGIINRLNPSQIIEQYLNFMSDHVLKLMKETDDYQRKEEIFFEYIKMINKKEYDFLDIEYISMNRKQKKEFIDSIETDGIFIHEPPFFGNTNMEQFKEIFRKHPEWCTEYNFVGVEKPMTMGDIYFIRLVLAFILLTAGNSLELQLLN